MLRAERERLPVLLAVVVEAALVALQDRLGDLRRARQDRAPRPSSQIAQVVLAALDRALGVVAHAQRLQVGASPAGQSPGRRSCRRRARALPLNLFSASRGCDYDGAAATPPRRFSPTPVARFSPLGDAGSAFSEEEAAISAP